MKKIFFLIAVCAWGFLCAVSGRSAEMTGCPILPADNIWNAPVDTLPKDANSGAYINTIGASVGLHPDFGSGSWDGGPIGIPYMEVPGTQPNVFVSFYYPDESDPGPYPIPPNAPIEGGADSAGDRHILILDRDNCILYELYDAYPQANGSWSAGSGAIFELTSNVLRPAGWTSADAAGLPIFPGLVRYDEVAAGEIKHAIRFTAPQTRRAYVWPARHYASTLTDPKYPPMGQRFRLKADYNISAFSPEVRVILTALKKYGMILADNGSSWFISGAPDERWNNDALHQLSQVTGANFEAVDVSSLMASEDSGQVKSSGQPYAPSDLMSTLNGYGIDLSWKDNSGNEANFVLERRTDDGGFGVVSQAIPADTTSFSDAGLAPDHTYTYRVKARNAFGDSGYSNESGKYVAAAAYTLTISSSPGGAVIVPGEGNFTYPAGTVVTLSAAPDQGYGFGIWTGDVADFKSLSTTVAMNSDKIVYANFVQKKTVHVADISMSLAASSTGKSAKAIVLIQNNLGNPVAGATVKGAWTGLVSGSVAGTTLPDGRVVFTSKKTGKKGMITFKVTGVSAPGYTYTPSQNLKTQASISTYAKISAAQLKSGASLASAGKDLFGLFFKSAGSNDLATCTDSDKNLSTSGDAKPECR